MCFNRLIAACVKRRLAVSETVPMRDDFMLIAEKLPIMLNSSRLESCLSTSNETVDVSSIQERRAYEVFR